MDPFAAGNPEVTYERYFVPAMFHPWADSLLRHAALKPGERVLDVACGTGILARLAKYRSGDAVSFPKFAHVAVAAAT